MSLGEGVKCIQVTPPTFLKNGTALIYKLKRQRLIQKSVWLLLLISIRTLIVPGFAFSK